MIPRLVQTRPLEYRDFCAALERFGNARYRFQPLNRIEGGMLCTVRRGKRQGDTRSRNMTVRLGWGRDWMGAHAEHAVTGRSRLLRPPANDGVHNILFMTCGVEYWTRDEQVMVVNFLKRALGWYEIRPLASVTKRKY